MFEHWSIFVQVIRRTKIYQFLGHPVGDTNTVAGKAIKSGFRPFVSPQAPKNYPLSSIVSLSVPRLATPWVRETSVSVPQELAIPYNPVFVIASHSLIFARNLMSQYFLYLI